MKRILAVTMVLGIAAMVANAGIAVTWSKVATYGVTSTTGTFTVERYQITASTDDGSKISAVTTYGKGPLVQNGAWSHTQLFDDNGDPFDPPQYNDVYTPTPTMNTQTTGTAKNADTHFLFSDTQLTTVVAPEETNDLSKGTTSSATRAWGLGTNTLVDPNNPSGPYSNVSYRSVAALKTEVQATSVTWFQFDIIAGTFANSNWAVYGGATNGVVETDFYIPEPATLSLIGLGGLAMLRRRRR